jgi:holo-[acyl-carrier protein] synthase
MPVRVGIDLVEVEEVRESIAAHGDRYIERVYTAAERSECGRDPRRLAARFAAKEAAFKALAGEGDRALPWHSIGVEDGATGRPRLRLTGAAAALAERRQARGFEVSLTEGQSVAAAVVLAEVGEPGHPLG